MKTQISQPKPIRVLQVVGRMHRGGLETMIMNLYRNIDRTKVQFDFLVHYDNPGDYDEEIRELGGNIYSAPVMEHHNFFKYKKELKKIFKEHSYAIVHGHWTALGIFYLKEAKKHGAKIRIAHSHNTKSGRGIKAFIIDLLQIRLERIANFYFSCSEDASPWLFSKKLIDNGKVIVIHNAIDVAQYIYNREKRNQIRKNLSIEDKLIIGHIGRFSYQKNHSFLLEIFEKVLMEKTEAELWLIGTGEDFVNIKQRIEEKGLTSNVRLWGVRDDIADLMQAMDIFTLPSRFEGLGIVLVEAQAAGLPCVASDAVPREVNLTGNVEFLPLSKPSDWAEKIMSFQDFERKDMTKKIVQAGYDIQEQAQKLQEFYLKEIEK